MGITGEFGVKGENDNGRSVIDFCAEKELSVSTIYFEDQSLYKYTRVARGQDGVEVMSMMDIVGVKKDILHYMQNVRAVRGM